jgi:hypothetical protein
MILIDQVSDWEQIEICRFTDRPPFYFRLSIYFQVLTNECICVTENLIFYGHYPLLFIFYKKPILLQPVLLFFQRRAFFIYCASVTGNSKATSWPVSFLYTPLKVSVLYSAALRSLGSSNTLRIREPSTLYLMRLPTISVG